MTYNIIDYGAVADGKTVNTESINRAVAECASNGGGRVLVPSGGVFVSGTILLKSNVELHLEHGATLKASSDFADYNADNAFPQNSGCEAEEWNGGHFILAFDSENIAVTGSGTINGNADSFVNQNNMKSKESWMTYVWDRGFARAIRPGQSLCFVECNHIKVEDVTVHNLPSWCLFVHGCDYVQIRGIKIFNPGYVANTDGIDIDSCRYVTVSDCIIDTGDDAIAIRNSTRRLINKDRICENITITNCVLSSCSSVFRIGVGMGKIRKVRVTNITAYHGSVLVNLCPEWSTKSHTPIEDVNFSDISATGISTPFCAVGKTGIEVKHITLENIRCDAKKTMRLCSDIMGAYSDITVRNTDIYFVDEPEEITDSIRMQRGDTILECRGVSGLTLDAFRVFVSPTLLEKWGSVTAFTDCDDLVMRNCMLPEKK